MFVPLIFSRIVVKLTMLLGSAATGRSSVSARFLIAGLFLQAVDASNHNVHNVRSTHSAVLPNFFPR